MYQLHDIQMRWRAGLEWVDKHMTQAGLPQVLFETVRQYLNILHWDEPTEIPGSGTGSITHDFAAYLSDNIKMSDIHIDMMFSHLGERVEQDDTLDAIVLSKTCASCTRLTRQHQPITFGAHGRV